MNALQIYRLLPKTNCGKCGPGTCMSFAVAALADSASLGGCPFLDPAKREELLLSLSGTTWKDDLVSTLAGEVSRIDLDAAAQGLGCPVTEEGVAIRCVGYDYLVGRDGSVRPEPKNQWITILLLHYLRNRGSGAFTGKWISFSELKGGFVKSSTFLRECEEPMKDLMDEDPPKVTAILKRLGAVPVGGYPADTALMIDLLPRVRCLILYTSGDDEFASTVKILFDGVTGTFLDVESLVFLCEGLVHTVSGMKQR